MKLKEVRKKKLFFYQHEFELDDEKKVVCRLMVMETSRTIVDLTVVTMPEFRHRGYGTMGVRMLLEWAMKKGYKTATLTNLFDSEAVDKIAKKLKFKKVGKNIWYKSINGSP